MAAKESSLKDLNLTKDEIQRIEDAFKKEEFRKLFAEYAEEISDPKNRALYEEEIRKMENERGMNVKFVNPTPGYVFKSMILGEDKKGFVNICMNELIEKPSCTSETKDNGRRGLMWSIPHSFSPPRDELDRHKKKCLVFDVVFHPDTLKMAGTNKAFRNMIEGTAVDGIEKQFNMKLDRNSIKYLKMTFKGNPQATVIRTKNSDTSSQPSPQMAEDDIMKNFPYPYDSKTTEEKTKENEEKQRQLKEKKEKEKAKLGPTVPKYTIVHQSDMDYQSYTNTLSNQPESMRPKNLVITIDLPLLNSAKTVDLDVFEKSLTLTSEKPAAYSLNIDLPYPIDDNNSSAKFDKNKHQLVVTLPVIKENISSTISEFIEPEAESVERIKMDLPENGSPLIQVMNSSDNLDNPGVEESKTEETRVEDEQAIWAEPCERKVPVKYMLPDFDCQQDNETISLSARVKNVSMESVTRSYGMNGGRQTASFKFVSVGSGGFPVHYSLTVRMREGKTIAPSQTTVDVTDDSVCIVLLKSKDCRQELWSGVEIGLDTDNLEEKSFPTDETLKQEYDALVALCQSDKTEPGTQENDRVPPLVLADEEHEQKFCIQIGSSDANDAEDVDYDLEPEDHDVVHGKIEVVHKHKVPNLQGILKQRSVSESSADDSMKVSRENSSETSLECSPRSLESDDSDRLRRSVSFSEHIDSATFKSNAAVTSMTVTLKSKRRRQRKRERRQATQRQRHHSTGSEYSSDDRASEHSDVDDAFVRPAPQPVVFEDDLVKEKNQANLKLDIGTEPASTTDEASKPTEEDHQDSDELSESEAADAKSETILTWEENPNTDPQHRTKCAFEFSNSVMFDLDVE